MNLDIKRIKNTPYKLVIGKNYDILGVFDHNRFVRKEHIQNEEIKHLLDQFHADSFIDRLEHCDG